jgi:hypothetical protein
VGFIRAAFLLQFIVVQSFAATVTDCGIEATLQGMSLKQLNAAAEDSFRSVPLREGPGFKNIPESVMNLGDQQSPEFWLMWGDLKVEPVGRLYTSLVERWSRLIAEQYGDTAAQAFFVGIANRFEGKRGEKTAFASNTVIPADIAFRMLHLFPSVRDLAYVRDKARDIAQGQRGALRWILEALNDANILLRGGDVQQANRFLETRLGQMKAQPVRHFTLFGSGSFRWLPPVPEVVSSRDGKPSEPVPSAISLWGRPQHRENEGLFPVNLFRLDLYTDDFAGHRPMTVYADGQDLGGVIYISPTQRDLMLRDIETVFSRFGII